MILKNYLNNTSEIEGINQKHEEICVVKKRIRTKKCPQKFNEAV